jgi:hypothetical protein
MDDRSKKSATRQQALFYKGFVELFGWQHSGNGWQHVAAFASIWLNLTIRVGFWVWFVWEWYDTPPTRFSPNERKLERRPHEIWNLTICANIEKEVNREIRQIREL